MLLQEVSLSHHLILFVTTLLTSSCLCEPSGYLRKEFSITKPYTSGTTSQNWELLGSTLASDDYLRLTPDEQSHQGAIWNRIPCLVRDWEIHISFKVHGQGTRLYGDGFAFWYSQHRSQLGDIFGSPDQFSGLGVFFDTYANQNGEHAHEHPYISAQVNNGSLAYDHDRDGTHSEVGGCTSYFRGIEGDSYVAIRYLGTEKRLTAQFDVEGQGKWQECFDIEDVHLPTGYFFGLSAATGDLSDNHDIVSVKFYELESGNVEVTEEERLSFTRITPQATTSADARAHIDDPEGSFSTRWERAIWFMYVFAAIMVALGIGFAIYYKKKLESDSKRFY